MKLCTARNHKLEHKFFQTAHHKPDHSGGTASEYVDDGEQAEAAAAGDDNDHGADHESNHVNKIDNRKWLHNNRYKRFKNKQKQQAISVDFNN